MATTPLPSPHEPFIDTATGKVTDVWYRFLNQNSIAANAALTSPVAIADGGTGQTTNTAAFDALAPSSPAQGDILYYNGTHWVVLAPGTSGYILETLGANANPAWADLATKWTRLTVTSPPLTSNSATLANVTGLGFAAAINTNYVFRGQVFYNTNATADIQFAFTGPSSPTLVNIQGIHIEQGGTLTGKSIISFTSWNSGGTGEDCVLLTGLVQNGANSGTVQLQWAQNSPSGTSTLRAGSFLEWMTV